MTFNPVILDRIARHGVRVYAVADHVAGGGGELADQLVLGFGSLGEEGIATGVERLAAALSSLV